MRRRLSSSSRNNRYCVYPLTLPPPPTGRLSLEHCTSNLPNRLLDNSSKPKKHSLVRASEMCFQFVFKRNHVENRTSPMYLTVLLFFALLALLAFWHFGISAFLSAAADAGRHAAKIGASTAAIGRIAASALVRRRKTPQETMSGPAGSQLLWLRRHVPL